MIVRNIADYVGTLVVYWSCILRMRWDRSHFEVAALLMVGSCVCWAMDVVLAKTWMSVAGGLINMIVILPSIYLTLLKAEKHNRPSQVGDWDTFERVFVVFNLMFGSYATALLALMGEWWAAGAVLLASGGLLLATVPGMDVDHEPPEAVGRLAMEGAS
jgi:hypothetical protein